jgi:DNA-binding MarR family transcriptional regulator
MPLGFMEEDGITQTEVCRRFGEDRSWVTRVAQSLEREGLVLRERDPDDGRAVRLRLTDKGRALIVGFPEGYGIFRRRIEWALSEEEARELWHLLDNLIEAMNY